MTPILFEANKTTFTSNGLGALSDAISCRVTMRGASYYELSMEYPVKGVHFSDIQTNRLILAKPCQTDDPQPFRIYRITRAIKGKVAVYARHISYDLLWIPVIPFTATSAADFASKIVSNAAVTCPFSFQTNISKSEDLSFDVPQSARSLLAENEQSWQAIYGGELVFDKFDVKLLTAAGQNRGVVIRYGVDLVDANMEESIANVCTGILPYYNKDGNLVVGDVLGASGTFDTERILPVDLTEYIATTPTTSDLASVGQTWMDENDVGRPEISLALNYAQINQTVRLHDTVTVKIEKMGIDVVAKVSATVYNVLKERYDSINVGDVRQTFAADMYDASRLKTGLLDLKRIADRSIGGEKMASGGVGSRALASGAVTSGKIANNSISEAKLQAQAVAYEKLASSVTGYFTGEIPCTISGVVKASQLRIGGTRVHIASSGYVTIESIQ